MTASTPKVHKTITFLSGLMIPVLSYASGITVEQQERLIHLLKHDCGSCHGITLQGGLGPALTKERISTLPREMVTNTIMYGRDGTPMPPWQAMLSKKEIDWIVDYLYSGEKGD